MRLLDRALAFLLTIILLPQLVQAQKKSISEGNKPDDLITSTTFKGLKLRHIGPALTSGRVIAFAVNPTDRAHYFVAAASGGVWKTTNAGTTWAPVFDNEGSYSIGTLAMEAKNPNVIWVGTGENNSQRSVGYGDGVYRSEDGGKSWQNMGLKASEHIARIVIDERNPNTVYVASQGPLWGPGGDRGLFKTTDGGKSWKNILYISENTGVTDLAVDYRNPDILYAAAYQRRRHVWTVINGGPESAIYKSTNAGESWEKLKTGLPTEEMGRIGLALSPADNRVIYATIEAANRKGGIFRSTDYGMTWEKRNDFDATALYYGKIFADPKDADRLYLMNTFIMVSDDGGKTLRRLTEKNKHVDSHVIWIDPHNTNYYLVGCDGGIYESFDRAASWSFKANLPITQFYDVAVDNAVPFYNVYGGTQDNFSLGGPSRTYSLTGITNADWFVTNGGDGFRSKVDPLDPNTIYAESQYGGLIRFDKSTGEQVSIKPQSGKGEESLRWNWDSPLIISSHSHTRLYFAANKLFRSDDRGNSWRAISDDLTRKIDRNKLPVMGKVWGPDAVAKSASTSLYGNITALAESPKREGLIYVGTDDGLIQVTEDNGANWRKIDKFPGVPEMTYVTRLMASAHDSNTVYACFDNHKNSDFAPYVLKSTDMGKSWNSIKANLPANGPVLAIEEDHVNAELLFLGTEFGLYFTVNGGQQWVRLMGGLPTIAIKDLAIQRRENDLVVATFGRGIYILDDYTPLRGLKAEMLTQESLLFPIKSTWLYVPTRPYGGRGKSFQGEAFYAVENPDYGATFTYHLKEALKTKKQLRQEGEKKGDTAYPTNLELRAEAEEEENAIMLTITDANGKVVRRLTGTNNVGINRINWDLRYATPVLPPPSSNEQDSFSDDTAGPLVMPGNYSVALSKRINGVLIPLATSQSFTIMALSTSTTDRGILVDFQRKVARLQRAVVGATELANSVKSRMALIKRALQETPEADSKLTENAVAIEKNINDILRLLRGDNILRARNENTPLAITDRVDEIVDGQRRSTASPTQTHIDNYRIAAEEFAEQLTKLRKLVEVDLANLEQAMEAANAPWTPGRIPQWQDK